MAKKYRYAKAAPCVQAVIFARVSTKEQEPGASLKAQKEAMEDYCNKKGLPIVQKYKAVESSTNGNRTKFNEMLDFVRKQKKKTAIVVHCIDRFQRRFNECVEVEEILLDDKTDLHFCKEGLILTKNSPSSDIMRWDMGILSGKMYVANLRDNVNRGMNYNWSIGKYQTKAPVGYLNVNKDIIVDSERAPLVKKMDDEVFSKIRLSCNILEPLKKCVQKKLIEESDANMVMKRKITMELNNLEAKERRVKDSFFEGDITRDEWQEEKAIIAAKREELQRTAEKYADISKDIQVTVNEILDIAATVSDIMKKADPTQQNKLLTLMLSECYLDGQKLIYKLQKPFDKLVNLKNANTWFDFDKSDIKEYETMAEKVQMYKVERETWQRITI